MSAVKSQQLLVLSMAKGRGSNMNLRARLQAAAKTAAVTNPTGSDIQDRLNRAAEAENNPLRAEKQAPKALPISHAVVESAPEKPWPRRMTYRLDEVKDNPFNARIIYKEEKIRERAMSIRANGQQVAALAILRNGVPILVDGQYRKRGLNYLVQSGHPEYDKIDVDLYPDVPDQELYAMSFRINNEREEQTPLDNAVAWKSLLDEKIFENDSAISVATGISKSDISKTLTILDLSEAIRNLVRTNPDNFSLSTLYQLTLYQKEAGPEKALEIAKRVDKGEISRRGIEIEREKLGKKRKPKIVSRQYDIQGGAMKGKLREWSNRISLDIEVTDQEKRQEIMQEFKEKFGCQ